MEMKGLSMFPKAPGLKTYNKFNVINRAFVGKFLPLCKDAVDVFYSPSWLNRKIISILYVFLKLYCCVRIIIVVPVISFVYSSNIYVWKFIIFKRNTWKRFTVDCLTIWFLWHINLCRLFNAKSVFMKIVQFQTIQFRKITQFKCKYSLIVKNISISSYSI